MDPHYTGTETFSIAKAEFFTEATWNYYVSRFDITRPVTSKTFDFVVDVNSQETMAVEAVNSAFYEIKDGLLAFEDEMTTNGLSDLSLGGFDLKIESKASNKVKYTVYCSYNYGEEMVIPNSGPNEDEQPIILNGNISDGYSWIGLGQCTMDFNSKTVSNKNLTAPGSPDIIRNLSTLSYWCYVQNPHLNLITNVYTVYITTSVGTPANPVPYNDNPTLYNTIEGYNNTTKLQFELFSNAPNSLTVSDNDRDLKEYLSRDMINHYVQYAIGYFVNNMPTGKVFTDINIDAHVCLCASNDASWSIGGWGYPFFMREHGFHLTYGTSTTITGPISSTVANM